MKEGKKSTNETDETLELCNITLTDTTKNQGVRIESKHALHISFT